MTKRLLLTAGVLGALAGCGGATAGGGVTTAIPSVQAIDTTTTHRLAADQTVSAAPAATPPAVTTPPPVETHPAAAPAHSAAATAAPRPTTAVPTAIAKPSPQRDLLTGPHGLNTRVGSAYTDCTGDSTVARDGAFIDTCHLDAVLFIGHNQGVFTPLLNYVVGDVINWYDGAGSLHHLRIVAVRDVSSKVFPPVLGTYEFQTCRFTTPNSPLDRDLDAVEV